MIFTAFFKHELIAQGARDEVVAAMRAIPEPARSSDLLAFDDESGRQVDLDLSSEPGNPPRKRGRPSLGVQAKEVTLLPRHWEWLARQRSGASATLRRMVEDALRKGRTPRERQDAAYWFLSVMAGDWPRFEDAVREIYAGNRVGYDHFSHGWPEAVRAHGRQLAFAD